jgi:hypothetical protein
MLMPVDVPSDSSRQLLDVLGIGGFDTWTPSLIAGAIPETVTDVLVLGTDRLASNTTTVP